jgi:hypothetical protein
VRVLVDASAAFDQPAGIGRYARNVLAAAAIADPAIAWTLARFRSTAQMLGPRAQVGAASRR